MEDEIIRGLIENAPTTGVLLYLVVKLVATGDRFLNAILERLDRIESAIQNLQEKSRFG